MICVLICKIICKITNIYIPKFRNKILFEKKKSYGTHGTQYPINPSPLFFFNDLIFFKYQIRLNILFKISLNVTKGKRQNGKENI